MTLDLLCCSDPGGHKLISCWSSRCFVWTADFGHPLPHYTLSPSPWASYFTVMQLQELRYERQDRNLCPSSSLILLSSPFFYYKGVRANHFQQGKNLCVLEMLLLRCSSSVYSSHDRQIIGRQGVEARKLGHPGRWCTSVLEYHLVWIWMLVCFIEQIGVGGESIKQKGVSLVEYLLAWPVLGRGCDNIFFFLFCIHSQMGSVRMSPCELNKGTLV